MASMIEIDHDNNTVRNSLPWYGFAAAIVQGEDTDIFPSDDSGNASVNGNKWYSVIMAAAMIRIMLIGLSCELGKIDNTIKKATPIMALIKKMIREATI